MKIEICATSFQSAKNAQLAGADRIELCSELGVGGITPSFGLIQKVVEELEIPVFVLIRPRSGNFVYSDDELDGMKRDIKICKELGCAGIVSGVLTAKNQIDFKRTQELIEISKPLEFTFHRAFDLVVNPNESLPKLIEIGVTRILTSGGETSAEKGLKTLFQLKNSTQNKLTILPGGGISPENVHLFKENGFEEIHASASSVYLENEAPKISFVSQKFLDEGKVYVSDLEVIKKLKNPSERLV